MASELFTAAIGKTLDGLFLRQLVISQNIANANSPGYVPLRVTFERALSELAGSASSDPVGTVARMRALQPQIIADPLAVAGQPMRIDLEISDASETTARYSALITVLDRAMQLRNLAVNGG